MNALLLDTHAWVWILTLDRKLPERVRTLVEAASDVRASPVSFFEIGQKIRLGKWPEMQPFVTKLPKLLIERGGAVAALTPEIALQAAALNWGHRDPFDRLIAATAMAQKLSLLSADPVFDTLASGAGWANRRW